MIEASACPTGDSNSLTAAVIAASVTVIVGYLTTFAAEQYKRHRDKTALAAALAGELASHKAAIPALQSALDALLKQLQSGEPIKRAKFDKPVDVVFDSNVEKLGLLGSETVETVVFVYNQLKAFRSSFAPLLTDPNVDNEHAIGIVLVCQTLIANAVDHGIPLLDELRTISRQHWHPFRFS